MNFNITRKPEYVLYKSCTREMIDLFGIKCKLALIKKLNISTIVNEWASLMTDAKAVFDITILPETAESFDTMDYQFNNFGFLPSDNISCFIAADDCDAIVRFQDIIGNLVILPSGKIMEISDANIQAQHTNNLYAYPDDKTVYQLRLVPYEFKLHDAITDKHLAPDLEPKDPDAEVIGELKTSLYKHKVKKAISSRPAEELEAITRENYKVLDDYIDRLNDETRRQDLEVIDPDDPIYDTKEVDVFHKL